MTELVTEQGKQLMESSYYCRFPESEILSDEINYIAIPSHLLNETDYINICDLKQIQLDKNKTIYKTKMSNIYYDLGINNIINGNIYPGRIFKNLKAQEFTIFKL